MLKRSVIGRLLCVGAATCAISVFKAGEGHADGTRGVGAGAPRAALQPISRELLGADRLIDPISDQGQNARGLYFNAPMQKRLGAAGIIRSVRAAGMNAVVIDFKDGEGRVSWDTQIPSLQPQKRTFIKDVPAFIREIKDAGIYVSRASCASAIRSCRATNPTAR